MTCELDQYWTIRQIAERTAISPSTLRRLIRQGVLAATRPTGTRLLVKARDVQQLLERMQEWGAR
jgi:excisionase family DNA binding protein